ncbi:hypothetical protein IU459_27635 [Nocardia amamiensis]|uniref:TetR family transcriptional regulator n=1 Tax=Nocardia amamiensis TaxID=404578 RepID=A0ABS0CXG3_9NOCA|nr:hypothetical protein [Nocardia amamiensis]MBF6301285.1 hypothetical protein [Nocardia amamiensis]
MGLADEVAAPDSKNSGMLAASDRAKLADLLAAGQRASEFRDFNTDMMAGFILALRNGVIARMAAEHDFDLDTSTTELLAAIRSATTV